jgi:2,5-diketo-D-gluconate reductase A
VPTSSLSPTIKLKHGAQVPRIGIGTSSFTDNEAEQRIAEAIGLGYRLIDTAANYRNEAGVGRAIASSGIDRQEIFITTKLNLEHHGRALVREAWAGSATRLGVDYLDLLMIHWPNPRADRYVDAWLGLTDLLEEGLVRAIGVSNFKIGHLQRLLDETGTIPDVNQVQLNPYLTRASVRAYHDQHGIITEAWWPLDQGRALLSEPLVKSIAEEYKRTPAQIVLRWHLQIGTIPIPRSSSPLHMQENIDVLDFHLDPKALSVLSSLDRDDKQALDSDVIGN